MTAGMHCPQCGSSDVGCYEDGRTHMHTCTACGHRAIYRHTSKADMRDEVRYPEWTERDPATGEVPE